LSLIRNPLINSREQEDPHEVEKFKEKNPATRETFTRGPKKTGQAKRKTEGGRGSKGAESREEICGSRHRAKRKEVCAAKNWHEKTRRCQETEEEIESFTGTSRATCGRDESQVGREESRKGEYDIRVER
jgi:hypothetical protein